jgi:isoquinoline 1-oxidoreductase beta subunit
MREGNGDVAVCRRGFLKGSAALGFVLSLRPGRVAAAAATTAAFSPNAMLRIDPDGAIRIIMPHAEMGQGVYTGIAQILADELDADWMHIVAEHLESLDAAFKHQEWGVIATGASTSVSSQWQHLREVGATARAMLVEAAAQRWGVSADGLTTSNSFVIDPTRDRRLAYAELTAAAAQLEPPAQVRLKTPDQFRLIGTDVPRLDARAKATGTATFGMDFTLPDLLQASIAHAPVFGATLRTFDATKAEAMPGVRKVVRIPSGVAVVADTFWQAKTAKDALELEWDEGAFAHMSSAALWEEYGTLAARAGPVFERRGTLDRDTAAVTIEGEFRLPFLAHAPMEPLNATARWQGDSVEIWSGTQFQGIDAAKLAAEFDVPVENVRIHTLWLGGSFGRRGAPFSDFVLEAAQIARAAGLPNPVKLVWQREDDVRGGFYRPMALHRYRIGLDAARRPVNWEHRVVCASISKGTPFEAAFMHEGFDTLSIEGLRHTNYNVPNIEFALHTTEHAVPVLWLRGEADSHTAPAVEGIMNRLAREAGQDPFAFRRSLLRETDTSRRIKGVLDALESSADWGTSPPEGVYRGMAVHPSFGSVVGYVVELRKSGKRLDFHRVVAAIDCGRVVNPASVRAQVYSAVAFALSMAIGQKIEIANGRAVQGNFHDYTVARLSHVPDVDVHFVDNGLEHPTGVGEPGVAPFLPALAAAVHAATGQEVNAWPMTLDGYAFLDGGSSGGELAR